MRTTDTVLLKSPRFSPRSTASATWYADAADSTDLPYDFSLKVGDVFKLPLCHVEAEVVSVDSITLLPGYRRNRITLRHLYRLYRERYGKLVWIEGIGSPAGIRYYREWSTNQK